MLQFALLRVARISWQIGRIETREAVVSKRIDVSSLENDLFQCLLLPLSMEAR